MNLVKLTIKGISYSQTQNGAYALILNEENGDRKLPIVIGAFEAQAIAIVLEKSIQPPRPLTHDLFKTFADKFDIEIKEVIIHKLVDGVFYSSILCQLGSDVQTIDARTSDAIALALRFDAPIFTYKNILDKAGIYLTITPDKTASINNQNINQNINQEPVIKIDSNIYEKKSISELHDLLDSAVSEEDYEKAAKIRDEISKR
jgi:bifunctional DNase/RNase